MQLLLKNKYILDLVATIMFFTRIPVNWSFFSNKAPDLTRAVWAFPIAGFLIGILSGSVGDFLINLGLSNFLSCVIAIALSVILTGAFHEDGLADTADAFPLVSLGTLTDTDKDGRPDSCDAACQTEQLTAGVEPRSTPVIDSPSHTALLPFNQKCQFFKLFVEAL